MPTTDDNSVPEETLYFSYFRTPNGDLAASGAVKQNQRAVPRFVPESRRENAGRRTIGGLLSFYREITYGLSRLERRTWLPLLLGWTIDDLARSQGVSRQAIYERIRGSSKGHGGMIRKNDYVAIWWRDQRNGK